jgi:hypothetical protein
MFRNRSVIELMVIVFTLVVSFALLATAAFIAVVEIRDPTVDTDQAVDGLFSAITVIVGALLGLLVGRSEGTASLSDRPDK